MSSLLWRAYHEDDLHRFKSILGLVGDVTLSKSRRKGSTHGLKTVGKGDVNVKDCAGLTILQRAVSSHQPEKLEMARLLLRHPNIDLYVQDKENGWTALHRALYFGNASIAKDILQRESGDLYQSGAGTAPGKGRGLRLSKMKDLEGHFPYDVYNATIIRHAKEKETVAEHKDDSDSDSDEGFEIADALYGDGRHRRVREQRTREQQQDMMNQERNKGRNGGDEFFAFGSNKNMTLGFGDEDDRQYPERITLKRPEHLLFRFYQESRHRKYEPDTPVFDEHGNHLFVSDLPALIRNKPIVIEDAQLSKLHSAILTSDPASNLHMCGVGSGGRLGMGDERTRFSYTCVEGGALEGKRVARVALGLNHTLAVTDDGDIMSWGTNTWSVLGYGLPAPPNNQEPVNSTPRQIFGILKKEKIIGVAASATHSAAFTRTALYTWGKNDGQLGITDADSRSLAVQTTPRRVGVSEITDKIVNVSVINRATVVLLANHHVLVLTNYGIIKRIEFPRTSAMALLRSEFTDERKTEIVQIASGGETIAAISAEGDLYTVDLSPKPEGSTETSTTKPKTIKKNSLTTPQHVWALRKGNWDGVKSVDVSENGSIILATKAGAVWRRVRRPNVKESSGTEAKSKDFQFHRVPGLTSVVAVRANAFGGFAAIRKDKDTPLQIEIQPQALREDIARLFPLHGVKDPYLDPETWDNYARAQRKGTVYDYDNPVNSMSNDYNVAKEVGFQLGMRSFGEEFDVRLCTTISDIEIPVHAFVLAARSPVFREALCNVRESGSFTIHETMTVNVIDSIIRLEFADFNVEALYNLAMYMYNDTFMDIWSTVGLSLKRPAFHNNWKSVRAQLLRIAPKLKMTTFETDVKNQRPPTRIMQYDFKKAIKDERFMEHGDTIVDLDTEERSVYTPLMRQRCPFFEQLFGGRSGGRWLAGRREESNIIRVDLEHVEPHVFDYVMKYIYSDCGPEMFDDVVAADLDEFSHVVMDVLAISDELMLDRLGEICQHVLGQLANSRNIAYLLNEVEPLAVKALKDVGLEYICLQLETTLDNHLLDDLDEEILHELDAIIQANQVECLPVTMKNQQLHALVEKHPELEEEMTENMERLLHDMEFRQTLRDEKKNQASSRGRLGSEDTTNGAGRHSKSTLSPPLRPTSSGGDMMFPLDVDAPLHTASPFADVKYGDPIPYRATLSPRPSQRTLRRLGKGKEIEDSPLRPSPTPAGTPMSASPKVWSAPATSSPKIVMKDIFSETLSSPRVDPGAVNLKDRRSSLSIELNAQREKAAAAISRAAPKMSQKERKRLAALQLQADLAAAAAAPSSEEERRPRGPWQAVKAEKVNLKDVGAATIMQSAAGKESDALKVPAIARAQSSSPRRSGSPDTRFSGQSRTPSASTPSSVPKQRGPALLSPSTSTITPHSKVYNTREGFDDEESKEVEAALQLSMQDIIDQQRLEAEIRKEQGKRPLKEIQEEQQFLEWWGEQERKVREEEQERERRMEELMNRKKKGRSRGKNDEKSGDKSGPSADNATAAEPKKQLEPRASRKPAASRQPKQERKRSEKLPLNEQSIARGFKKHNRGHGGSSMVAKGSCQGGELAPMTLSAPALAPPATTTFKAHAPEFKPNVTAPAFVPGQSMAIPQPSATASRTESQGSLPNQKRHRGPNNSGRGRRQGQREGSDGAGPQNTT